MTIEFIDGLNYVQRMPGKVAFMYSPQPFSVHGGYSAVTVTVTNKTTGARHSESRALHDKSAHFELSRIIQYIAPDVDEVMLMDSPVVPIGITVSDELGAIVYETAYNAIYGVLDQLERYQATPASLRVWLNYPQTMQAWRNTEGRTGLRLASGYVAFDNVDGNELVEAPIMESLLTGVSTTPEAAQVIAKLEAGQRVTVERSAQFAMDAMGWRGIDWTQVTLIPEVAPRGTGTYLRWLNRDGSRGYWHFKLGTLSTTSAERSSFQRHLDGNPAEAVSGVLRSRQKIDYAEAQQLTIGAACNTMSEYNYLCGLATSPVVERLVTFDGVDLWQRVTVLPGALARSLKYGTPYAQQVELTLELPERNTIRL